MYARYSPIPPPAERVPVGIARIVEEYTHLMQRLKWSTVGSERQLRAALESINGTLQMAEEAGDDQPVTLHTTMGALRSLMGRYNVLVEGDKYVTALADRYLTDSQRAGGLGQRVWGEGLPPIVEGPPLIQSRLKHWPGVK